MPPATPPPAPLVTASWQAVERLLDEALSRPAAEREAWLAALPAEHGALKGTLAQLLAVQAGVESADFLGTLPRLGPGAVAADAAGPAADDAVGPWRLLREIGEGGMGSVWLAERADGSLKRQVALKLPRLSWARGLAERMARERDILATLEHPHIARLYDAGVDALGRPWLALEFVQGRPLDLHARERGLGVRPRVELLLQVCAAVAYAHGRLVIHRDLKPGNILVGGDGQVKLLDFGIAKLVQLEGAAATALTALAGRAMTLDYASPEQVRGEPLTTASDVYSLGVVAYELLAGVRPYRLRRGSAAELEEAIAQGDLPPCSRQATDPAARRALRGDLDAILAQALKPLPAERYASVDAFAQDLARHLRLEPVLARRDGWRYRAGRFVRRHRLPVAAAGAVALALTGGAGAALWQAQQARTAAAQARQEATTARAVQAFIESVFSANTGDQAQPGTARETTARNLLDRGAARIAGELRDAPAARLRLLALLASMYEDLTAFDRQRVLQEQRLALAREIERAPGDETVAALADLAHALAISGREADARRRLDEADAILARRPDASAAARLRVVLRRASVHRADDPARAALAAEQALALTRALPPAQELVLAMYLAAEARSETTPATAEPLLAEAIALVERRPELGASVLAALHSLSGDVQRQLRRPQAAEASYRRAFELERSRGNSGATLHFLAVRLGLFLVERGRCSEAAEVLAPSWAWARPQQADFETTVPMVGAAYGRALLGLGRLAEGLAALDRAAVQAAVLQDAPDIAPRIALARAHGLIELGRLADAAHAIDEAERTIVARGVPYRPQLAEARRALLLARGEATQALALWRQERRGAGQPERPAPGGDAAAAVEAARLHLAAGDAETATAIVGPGIAAGEPAHLQTHARQLHGQALLALGRAAQAQPLLEQAAAGWRALVDEQRSPRLAETLEALASALAQTQAGSAEVQRLRREAAAIRGRQRGEAGAPPPPLRRG